MTGRFTHRRASGFHKAVCEAQNCLHLAWIWIKLFCISWNCLWSPKSSAVTLSPRSLDGLILPWQWHTGLAGVYTVLVQSSSSQHLRPSSLLHVADFLHKFMLMFCVCFCLTQYLMFYVWNFLSIDDRCVSAITFNMSLVGFNFEELTNTRLSEVKLLLVIWSIWWWDSECLAQQHSWCRNRS